MMRHLFYGGDNLAGLELLRQRGVSVDLVYIDPPFATNNEFRLEAGRANSISGAGEPAYADTLRGGEYLEALGRRLAAIRRLMAPAGSIYVHIDVKMEHRVRRLLDETFGEQNFRNSITRIKCNPKNFPRYSYGNIKDSILFYSVSPQRITWNPQKTPLSGADLRALYPKVDAQGRRYATVPLHAPGATAHGATGQAWRGRRPPRGRHWRSAPERLDELDAAGLIEWSAANNPRRIIYADESAGKMPQDVWEYKDPQRPRYPTEKPAALLRRIIQTSSNPGDTVLDCYAGGGGTLAEAAGLGRRFIGMDNAPAAQKAIAQRLAAAGLALVPGDDGFLVFTDDADDNGAEVVACH